MFLKFKRNNNLFPRDTLMSTISLPTVPNLASQHQGWTSPSFEKVTLMGPSVFDPPHILLLEVGLCASRSEKQKIKTGSTRSRCCLFLPPPDPYWVTLLFNGAILKHYFFSTIWVIPSRITPGQGSGSLWSLLLDPEEAFTPHWDSLNPHSIFLSLFLSHFKNI